MKFPSTMGNAASTRQRLFKSIAVCTAAATLLLAGCKHGEEGTRVAGWSLVDPTQRHPIMVTQQPSTLSLRVARGSYGLSPHQRAQTISFLQRYRAVDASNSRLVIEAPSGSANEVAAMQAVAEIRTLMSEVGFDPSDVAIEAVQAIGDPQAPIRVSYLRYVAEAPQCGRWSTNLAATESNLNYPNLGCATQANLAAMVANPADLVTPRGRTPVAGERRDTVWEKYVKGESTIAAKQADEKVQVKGN